MVLKAHCEQVFDGVIHADDDNICYDVIVQMRNPMHEARNSQLNTSILKPIMLVNG